MPRFIMKAAPDENLYVEWSSIVEAPTWLGSRAELAEYLSEHRFDGMGSCTAHSPDELEQRLARVDATGTSIAFRIGKYIEGSWEDDGTIYQQQGWLPRSRLSEFLHRFLASPDEEPDVADLLDPFED